jgi:hypothetical protein
MTSTALSSPQDGWNKRTVTVSRQMADLLVPLYGGGLNGDGSLTHISAAAEAQIGAMDDRRSV